jgi:hypothetical protein
MRADEANKLTVEFRKANAVINKEQVLEAIYEKVKIQASRGKFYAEWSDLPEEMVEILKQQGYTVQPKLDDTTNDYYSYISWSNKRK